MDLDLRKIRTLLEGALSVSDMLTDGDTVKNVRTARINKTLTAALPEVVSDVSRAELLRLIWLCGDYLTEGEEQTLQSACELGQQLQRGTFGHNTT
jgi:hypothetical protein